MDAEREYPSMDGGPPSLFETLVFVAAVSIVAVLACYMSLWTPLGAWYGIALVLALVGVVLVWGRKTGLLR